MKIGFGTVLWGRRIDDLEYTLDVIAACGYHGVEIAQHHKQIFLTDSNGDGIRPLRDIAELLEHLEKRSLKLIGMVGGSLTERIKFLGEHRDAYLYVDRWPEKEVQLALENGFTIAIHPHWLTPIHKVKQALRIIQKYQNTPYARQVRLILDTAHAVVAEDDPVEIVKHHDDKLAALHIKSWRPDYGRWSHRYAHGFCTPDDGIVPVAKVMDVLSNSPFSGWFIMEQDHYDVSREQTALHCAQWIQKEGKRWGTNIAVNETEVEDLRKRCQINPYFKSMGKAGIEEFVLGAINGDGKDLFPPPLTARALSGPLSELFLGRVLSRRISHHPNPAEFYSIVSVTVRSLLNSQCVKIWSYNPLIGDFGEFSLVGIDAPGFETSGCQKAISGQSDSMAGSILTHPAIQQFDMRNSQFASLFTDVDWLETLQEKAPWFLILPVFNTSNTHQLRYLITSASEQPLLAPLSSGTFDPNASFDRMGQLDAISWIMAHWADYLTNEICSAASGFTNHLCGNLKQTVTEFVDSLIGYLEKTFECNAVTVFLEDFSGKRLEPVGISDSKLQWEGDEHFYTSTDHENHTWKAWTESEIVFSSSAKQGKEREKRPTNDTRNEILFAPLTRWGGKCHGVVRLHNKRLPQSPMSSMFTDDDAAKLDAIIQTALPHLELLRMQEQQLNSLARMVHEFQAPLVAIRGAVDLMQSDLQKKEQPAATFFRRDYLDDVLQWTELMGRLTRNARVFAAGGLTEHLRSHRTYLLSEVVMPVLRQIRPLVPEGVRFDSRQEDLKAIPPLWIDRNQMQQVFFNLLSNAIKYAASNDHIRVVIGGGPVGNCYTVFFEDWGAGINSREADKIFTPGYRGEKAVLSDVSGQGLGLHVVRSIVEAHGGNIHVRNLRHPTTMEINLPQSLRYKPQETPKRNKYE